MTTSKTQTPATISALAIAAALCLPASLLSCGGNSGGPNTGDEYSLEVLAPVDTVFGVDVGASDDGSIYLLDQDLTVTNRLQRLEPNTQTWVMVDTGAGFPVHLWRTSLGEVWVSLETSEKGVPSVKTWARLRRGELETVLTPPDVGDDIVVGAPGQDASGNSWAIISRAVSSSVEEARVRRRNAGRSSWEDFGQAAGPLGQLLDSGFITSIPRFLLCQYNAQKELDPASGTMTDLTSDFGCRPNESLGAPAEYLTGPDGDPCAVSYQGAVRCWGSGQPQGIRMNTADFPDGLFGKRVSGYGAFWTATDGAQVLWLLGEDDDSGFALYALDLTHPPASWDTVDAHSKWRLLAPGPNGTLVVLLETPDGNRIARWHLERIFIARIGPTGIATA